MRSNPPPTEKQMIKKRRNKMILITIGLVFAGLAAGLLASYGIGLPCIFHELTGLDCPGCGNTRAAVSILKLDFAASFSYNPMFIPEALYLLWVYFNCAYNYAKGKRFSYKPRYQVIDLCLLIVLMVWFVLRNIDNVKAIIARFT